mgnify:CR=1 FL=1
MTSPRAGSASPHADGAVIIAATLGEYSLLIMPFIVTAMMTRYGLSEGAAGNLVSAQLVAMGVAGFAVSRLLGRIPAWLMAGSSAATIVLANALCALATSPVMLTAGRALTGLGEGVLMASAGAMAAGLAHAHRLYSRLGFVIASVAAVALLITPYLTQHVGPQAVFWFLAACPALVVVSLRWLPRHAAIVPHSPTDGALRIPGAVALLVSFALLWVGASGLWVFAELIGQTNGLSSAEIGLYLAIGQVAGIAGPVLAARYAERFGLRRSIMAGNATMAVAGLTMVLGHSALSYSLGSSFLSIAIMFLAPCYRSLMAHLDASGRVVAMSVGFYTVGFAAAPLLVGVIHQGGSSYGDVATLSVCAFALSGLLIAFPTARRDAAAAVGTRQP